MSKRKLGVANLGAGKLELVGVISFVIFGVFYSGWCCDMYACFSLSSSLLYDTPICSCNFSCYNLLPSHVTEFDTFHMYPGWFFSDAAAMDAFGWIAYSDSNRSFSLINFLASLEMPRTFRMDEAGGVRRYISYLIDLMAVSCCRS